MPGARSRLKEAFGEKSICDAPVLRPAPELLGQGVLVTTRKIVVSLPDAHADACNSQTDTNGFQNGASSLEIRNFVDLQHVTGDHDETWDLAQKYRQLSLPAPHRVSNLVQMSSISNPSDPDVTAVDSQHIDNSVDTHRNGLIKVRRKDALRQSNKGPTIHKGKAHRRSQARISNGRISDIPSDAEEFPFNAYDSVESMVAKDGFQSDFLNAPCSTDAGKYQVNGLTNHSSNSLTSSFLPKLPP